MLRARRGSGRASRTWPRHLRPQSRRDAVGRGSGGRKRSPFGDLCRCSIVGFDRSKEPGAVADARSAIRCRSRRARFRRGGIMIKYRLNCAKGHDFEAWFRNSDAHDWQARHNEIVCPHCGDNNVAKAIMAPAVASRVRNPAGEASPAPAKPERAAPSLPAEALHVLRELRREVEANSDYV